MTLHDWSVINALNAELNPICHLQALVGAHHILHVSRVRVKDTLYEGSFIYWAVSRLTLVGAS